VRPSARVAPSRSDLPGLGGRVRLHESLPSPGCSPLCLSRPGFSPWLLPRLTSTGVLVPEGTLSAPLITSYTHSDVIEMRDGRWHGAAASATAAYERQAPGPAIHLPSVGWGPGRAGRRTSYLLWPARNGVRSEGGSPVACRARWPRAPGTATPSGWFRGDLPPSGVYAVRASVPAPHERAYSAIGQSEIVVGSCLAASPSPTDRCPNATASLVPGRLGRIT
jgi:hypothetical protein